MILVKNGKLPASYCGADVKLSVAGAFQIVEDMVTELMGQLRIDGVTCMREYGAMWVFVRNRIELPEPLGWMDEYTASCRISSFTRAKLFIDTALEKPDGTLALASRLELCAVDLETGRIRKSETVGVGENTPPEESPVEITYSRLKPVRGELLDEVTVRSTDIDYAHHTNNISYVRYCLDQYTADQLIERPARSIEMQYTGQTHEGDKLSVFSCEGQADTFMIEKDGDTVVRCILGF